MNNEIVLALLFSFSLLPICSKAQGDESVGSGITANGKGKAKKASEYKLAGLRPGMDTIGEAYSRFHKNSVIKELSDPHSAVWLDTCNRQMLTVVFDTKGIIQEVSVHPYTAEADCAPKAYQRSERARIGSTGQGLLFGSSCDGIQQIYGMPQSQGRSDDGYRKYLYSFGGGVKEHPLTLELRCDTNRNRIVVITLTALSIASSQ